MRAKDGTIRYFTIAAESASWATRLVMLAFAIVASIGLFLLERRIVGALSEPLPVLQLLATATLVAVVVFLFRERFNHGNLTLSSAAGAILVFAVACSFQGGRIADWLIWLAASAAAFAPSIHQRVRSADRSKPTSIRVINIADDETDADVEKILQNIRRVRTADGQVAIRGTLLAEFQAGEKQTTLHVAFCPPFERLPEVDANVIDDSDADLKLTEVFHHGTQLEIRLPEIADENVSVEIEFFATDTQSE